MARDSFGVLIIEDSQEKSRIIENGLRSSNIDFPLEVRVVENLIDALDCLRVNYYDLLIVDIRIPASLQRPSAANSRIIIEQLASGRLIMPACVIGLTAYEEDYQSEATYYLENLFSIEKFRADGDEWLKNIVSRIKFTARWKTSYGRARNFDYDYDVIMITARFKSEFAPIAAAIEWVSGPNDDLLLYKSSKLKTGTIRAGTHLIKVAIACTEETGLASASAVTAQLVDQFRPRVVMMLGMCCGFRQDKCHDKSRLGDVIIVREAACWDEGRYGEVDQTSFFFNRAKPLMVEPTIDRLISSLVESEPELFQSAVAPFWNDRKAKALRKKFMADTGPAPDIKYGLMLSGSSVIAHDVKGDEIITRFTNALGLEMEIFGVFKAVDRAVGAKPVMIAVKGVADFGDGAKHKEFQALSSRLSYSVGRSILQRYFDACEPTPSDDTVKYSDVSIQNE